MEPEVQQNSFSDNTNGLRFTRIVISNPINTQVFISLFSAPHGGASPEQLELSFTPFLVVSKPEVATAISTFPAANWQFTHHENQSQKKNSTLLQLYLHQIE